MKIFVAFSVGAAAILTLSLAAPLNAQVQAERNKEQDNTRVYAYQKRAQDAPPTGMQGKQKQTPFYISNEIPYGSQTWWREHERMTGGNGE